MPFTLRGAFAPLAVPRPVSLATMYMWGAVWMLYGAAMAAWEYVGGPEGLGLALFILVPVPLMLYCTALGLKADKKREVKPSGAA